jgi:hypothetical protein
MTGTASAASMVGTEYAAAVKTFWRINTIWKQSLGGITVEQALKELGNAHKATPLASPLYRHIATLTNDICNNAMDPEDLEEAV